MIKTVLAILKNITCYDIGMTESEMMKFLEKDIKKENPRDETRIFVEVLNHKDPIYRQILKGLWTEKDVAMSLKLFCSVRKINYLIKDLKTILFSTVVCYNIINRDEKIVQFEGDGCG